MERLITPKRLQDELNSEAFISGLDATIDFTVKTGREAKFGVRFVPEIGSFYYPRYISLGDECSVGRSHVKMNSDSRLIKEFRKIHPQIGPNEDIASLMSRYGEEFAEFMNNKTEESLIGTQIPYPRSEDFERKSQPQPTRISYDVLDVHTHPSPSSTNPSGADLQSLNEIRKYAQERLNEARRANILKCDFPAPNPISIIAGSGDKIDRRFGGYPLMIVQERTNSPLSEDSEFFERMAAELYESSDKRPSVDRMVAGIFDVTAKAKGNGLGGEAERNYKLIRGVYLRDDKAIGLCSGKRWPVIC